MLKLFRYFMAAIVLPVSLTVSCTKNETIKTDEPGIAGIQFTFSDNEIAESAVSVYIVPSSDDAPYAYGIVKSEDFNGEALASDFVSAARKMAEEKGKKLSDVLDVVCSKGKILCSVSTPAATDWTVYAFEVDAKGNTGKVYSYDVTSLGEKVSDGYAISVTDITATGAIVSVTPDPDAGPYYFDVVDEETFAVYGNDLARYVPAFFAQVAEVYGIPLEQAVSELLVTGESSFEYKKLLPETGYTAFVVTLKPDGNIFGKTYVENFRTAAREVSGMTIGIEILETEATSVKAAFTPSDNGQSYFYEVWTASTVESYSSDDKVISAMTSSYGSYISYLLKKGPQEYLRDDLQPETEYYVLAFGYDLEKGVTTGLFKEKFRTLQKGASTGVTFDISVSNITMYNADIDITPSDNSVFYLYNCLKKSDYEWYGGTDEGLQQFVDETIELLMQRNPGVSREEIVSRSGGYGNKYYKATSLEPGTDYYVYAVTADAEGKFIGKPQMQSFRTVDADVSSATVKGFIDRYFDGDEMAGLYPDEFGGCEGYACASVRIEKSADAKHFYMHIFEGDLSGTAEYSDAILISNLMTYGEFDPESLDYLLDWGKTYTLVGAALDAEGNFGAVSRVVYKITKEGASDPSDYS